MTAELEGVELQPSFEGFIATYTLIRMNQQFVIFFQSSFNLSYLQWVCYRDALTETSITLCTLLVVNSARESFLISFLQLALWPSAFFTDTKPYPDTQCLFTLNFLQTHNLDMNQTNRKQLYLFVSLLNSFHAYQVNVSINACWC